ncbi:MAG: hypothetical protein RBS85_05140 [Methanofastidiosum sp.]|jgi:hypothetical protein|nr:hypothetical protein [Methanofastidiosum sp.]
MKKNYIIGIAVIFLIAMVSIGTVLSYRGQADATDTCPKRPRSNSRQETAAEHALETK